MGMPRVVDGNEAGESFVVSQVARVNSRQFDAGQYLFPFRALFVSERQISLL